MVSPSSERLLDLEDYLLLAPLLLLPWAFGGVEIWAYRSAALVLAAAACTILWKRGWAAWGIGCGTGWLLPAFLLGVWAAIQIVPMPPSVIRSLSPETYRLYESVFPGYGGAPVDDQLLAMERKALERVPEAAFWPAPDDPPALEGLTAPDCLAQSWRTLSVQPSETLEALTWYLALLLGFIALRERLEHRGRRSIYLWALFGLFGALALFALIQMQFWNGKIYWVRQVLTSANPIGPYFNPTNLAGVMELAVPALVGYAWSRLRRHGRAVLGEASFGAAVVGAVFCFAVGIAAASKLAAALIVTGLVALGLLAARTLRVRATLLAVLILAIGAGIPLLTYTRLGDRLEMFLGRSQEMGILEGRLVVWQAGMEMFRDFPVTGSGFGAFGEVIARYLPAGAARRWGEVHNDYLEVLLEGGLVAAILGLWLGVSYLRRVVQSLRRDHEISPQRIGLIVGVVSLAVHAAFDFNHQIPANALLWIAFCALIAHGHRRHAQGAEA